MKKTVEHLGFRLDLKVDVTILGFLKGRKERKEKKKGDNSAQKGKREEPPHLKQMNERVEGAVILAGEGGENEKGRVVGEEGGRKERKKARGRGERMRPRWKYGGGINQNVRITARCLNFEKRQYLRIKHEG